MNVRCHSSVESLLQVIFLGGKTTDLTAVGRRLLDGDHVSGGLGHLVCEIAVLLL